MTIEPIRVKNDTLEILDQRQLPLQLQWLQCSTGDHVIEAIKALAVRGAPALGIAGLYALWLEALRLQKQDNFSFQFEQSARNIRRARPTAVNLAWAVDRAVTAVSGLSPKETVIRLRAMADSLKTEDLENNYAMGRWGTTLFSQPAKILTHCNTGSLATAGYGTALGVIRTLYQRQWITKVWVDETRPLLQGARLTAWELQQDQIPATLVTDSMAGHLMARGEVDAVIVGADRIAHNGDTANKIGTYGLAVLARYHKIPFYVAAPLSTLDRDTASGTNIPIEQRDEDEVRLLKGVAIAPMGMPSYNPAFDVTPHELITAIITERGVMNAPFDAAMDKLLEEARDA